MAHCTVSFFTLITRIWWDAGGGLGSQRLVTYAVELATREPSNSLSGELMMCGRKYDVVYNMGVGNLR